MHLWPLIFVVRAQTPLQWRHNERDGVSNHRRLDCLLNRLFGRRSNKTPKLCVIGLCEGNSPVTNEYPAHKGPVTRKMFQADDVIMQCSSILAHPSGLCKGFCHQAHYRSGCIVLLVGVISEEFIFRTTHHFIYTEWNNLSKILMQIGVFSARNYAWIHHMKSRTWLVFIVLNRLPCYYTLIALA